MRYRDYLLRRLLYTIPALIGLSMLIFVIARLMPGDPARLALGPEASAEQVQNLREELGLNLPIHIQYLHYMGSLFQGKLGISLYSHRDVLVDLKETLPATLELVTGFPTRVGGQDAELTTPTGAAIVTTLAVPVDSAPLVSLEKSGLGAGDRELPDAPNMLRLILGQGVEKEARGAAGVGEKPVPNVGREQVLLLEATIDDMDAEMFGRFMEIALAGGALDVFFTSIQMKKNRPGVLLSVLCKEKDRDSLVEAVFRETTTLGIRIIPQERWVLDREVRRVELELGSVRVKVGRFRGEIVNIAPEYEDLKSIADSSGLPLKQVKQLVMEHWTELER